MLDAAGARSVVEVGAYAGDLTGLLVDWAAKRRARVGPSTRRRSPSWSSSPSERAELELVRETSLEALRHDPAPGRGRYRRRPQLVHGQRGAAADRRAAGDATCRCCSSTTSAWPHARRDDYFDPT